MKLATEMRKVLLFALVLAVTNCRKPAVVDSVVSSSGRPPRPVPSPPPPPPPPPAPLLLPEDPAIKNLQAISTERLYEAFGFIDYSRQNIYTYYYRRGTSHASGGNPVYREYNALTKQWSKPVTISTDARDASISGGRMDNDTTVLFIGRSNNGSNGDYHVDFQIVKADSNNRCSQPVDFNWGSATRLDRQLFFGHVVKGEKPGEYFMPMYQMNIVSVPERLVQCFHTTDYWNTYHLQGTIYDGTLALSETSMTYLGNGRLLALTRNDRSGVLVPFESTNNGVTWTMRRDCNLYWWAGAAPEIPFIYSDTAAKTFDVLYECRDANMIEISRANDLTNFGNENPVYSQPNIYAHNFGGGSNVSLGYPSMIRMKDNNFLVVFSKAISDYQANLFFTADAMINDMGLPQTPQLTASAITTNSFRVDITGYDDQQLQNVRWFSADLSDDSSFHSFTTCKYRSDSYPVARMQDIKMTGLWDTYSQLEHLTSYWLRIKACNTQGCSAYSVIRVVTSP